MPTAKHDEIPYGTLDMIILRALEACEEMHGFEIAEWIQDRSNGVLQVEEGSLYPALQRLLVNGWVTAEWGRTSENRRARYYRLTHPGRRQLKSELERYQRVTVAIASILEPTS